MHPTAAQFRERARAELDFDPRVAEFPEGTKTAADAAEAVGCSVGQIVKSIALVVEGSERVDDETTADDEAVVVVLTAGDHRVDEAALADALDADDVGQATPDEVSAATGWSIGGVPPFCYDAPVSVYLDESLRDHEEVWAAAGTPEAVFALTPAELRELADPTPVDAFERA